MDGLSSLSPDCFKKTPLFASSDTAFLETMIKYLEVEMFPVGSDILVEGSMGDKMYLLYRGSVEVLIGPAQMKVAEIPAGSVFGEMALFGNPRRSATIRALEFCDCRVIKHKIFNMVLHKFPKEQVAFAAIAKERLAALEKMNKDKEKAADEKRAQEEIAESKRRASVGCAPSDGPTAVPLSARRKSHAGHDRARRASGGGYTSRRTSGLRAQSTKSLADDHVDDVRAQSKESLVDDHVDDMRTSTKSLVHDPVDAFGEDDGKDWLEGDATECDFLPSAPPTIAPVPVTEPEAQTRSDAEAEVRSTRDEEHALAGAPCSIDEEMPSGFAVSSGSQASGGNGNSPSTPSGAKMPGGNIRETVGGSSGSNAPAGGSSGSTVLAGNITSPPAIHGGNKATGSNSDSLGSRNGSKTLGGSLRGGVSFTTAAVPATSSSSGPAIGSSGMETDIPFSAPSGTEILRAKSAHESREIVRPTHARSLTEIASPSGSRSLTEIASPKGVRAENALPRVPIAAEIPKGDDIALGGAQDTRNVSTSGSKASPRSMKVSSSNFRRPPGVKTGLPAIGSQPGASPRRPAGDDRTSGVSNSGQQRGGGYRKSGGDRGYNTIGGDASLDRSSWGAYADPTGSRSTWGNHEDIEFVADAMDELLLGTRSEGDALLQRLKKSNAALRAEVQTLKKSVAGGSTVQPPSNGQSLPVLSTPRHNFHTAP